MAATCTSSFLGTSLSARPRTAAPAGEPFAVLDCLGATTALLSAKYELHKGLSTGPRGEQLYRQHHSRDEASGVCDGLCRAVQEHPTFQP